MVRPALTAALALEKEGIRARFRALLHDPTTPRGVRAGDGAAVWEIPMKVDAFWARKPA